MVSKFVCLVVFFGGEEPWNLNRLEALSVFHNGYCKEAVMHRSMKENCF